jgi:hypothetical protein
MTINLENATRQMRLARRMGKISNLEQTKIFRKLQRKVNGPNEWEKMMLLRASIAVEIAPVLEAKRKAELDTYDIKYVAPAEKIKGFVPRQAKDATMSPQWWIEAGKRDAAMEKAIKQSIRTAGKAAGLNKEQINHNILVALGEDM